MQVRTIGLRHSLMIFRSAGQKPASSLYNTSTSSTSTIDWLTTDIISAWDDIGGLYSKLIVDIRPRFKDARVVGLFGDE